MNDYPLAEQKLVYRVLHQCLTRHLDLLESEFFYDLQRSLQRQAASEDVDVSDHGAWDAWLGNEIVACESRLESRSVLG